MSKYGKAIYGMYKYGPYTISVGESIDLSDLLYFRFSTISSNRNTSPKLINQKINITNSGGLKKIRLRSNNSEAIICQSLPISDFKNKIRIHSVLSDGSKSQALISEHLRIRN